MASTPAQNTPLTIALLAGELSGDNLGAPLIKALQARYPDARFVGVGGPRMIAAGLECWTELDALSVNGFVEPLKRLPSLLRILWRTRDKVLAANADVFIGIDFNFFNGLLEGMLKGRGVPTVHYVSPSVWAWRKGRIRSIKKNVDLMLTLYPFERQIYLDNGIDAVFVGHPRADEISLEIGEQDKQAARATLGLAAADTVIALLPGSRSSEVAFTGPDFLGAAQRLNQRLASPVFVIPAANDRRQAQLQALVENLGQGLQIQVLAGQAQTAMLAADAVLVNSGTATLEALLLRRPMVMSYRLGNWTYKLVSRLVTTRFFALPNILADREIVTELIQDKATPDALCAAVLQLLDADNREAVLADYDAIHRQLRRNAGEQAATAVQALLTAGEPLSRR